MIRHSGTLVLVLGAALCCTECGREAPRAEVAADTDLGVPVAAEAARRGNLRAVIRTTGIVTPVAGSEFIAAAQEPAQILDIPKAAGDRVASGDLLVRFDMPAAGADAARQGAEIARAQARLENSRIAQTRARDLLDRGIISRREMEDADRDVADAQADVARAEAARTAADASRARAIIRAPFAGVIAQRLHNPGDIVQGIATDPILRLVDPDRLEITAPIPAADAQRVLPGAAARVTSIAGPSALRLTVASRPEASGRGGDPLVRLAFAESATIAVDTRVDIEIDGEEHVDAVLVPAIALIRQGTEIAVLVAAGTRAERRVVTTGLANDENVEITSGVKAGELVITRGHTRLADGATISVDTSSR
jgi:RND family efflux transporter MFP subunit